MKKTRPFLLTHSRWLFELAFICTVYFILLSIFVGAGSVRMIDHIYTSIFLVTLIIAGAVNSLVIRKRLLTPGRFWIFVGLSLVNIAFWALFNQVLFESLIDYILPGYYFISYYEYIDLFKFFLGYVTGLTLLELSWEWFQLEKTRHRMLAVEKEKISAELRALTNQVNPHFLFNSLTVLYSLSLKNSSDTSGAILKLSDILRYVIYEAGRGEVSLQSEVALIHNYIDLQRYRVPREMRIDFEPHLDDESIPVAPMLFLPLVENAFKHGITADVRDTFIHIRLESRNGCIYFSIKNNKADVEYTSPFSSGGVGLKNIEERLRLLYPSRHKLAIHEDERVFELSLQLE